jgi:hypothetical protein
MESSVGFVLDWDGLEKEEDVMNNAKGGKQETTLGAWSLEEQALVASVNNNSY